jgi:hypothetical protein
MWRQEVQIQSASSDMVSRKTLGEVLSWLLHCWLLVFADNLSHSMACACTTPISGFISTCWFTMHEWLCLNFPLLLRTPVLAFRTHPNLTRSYLDYISKEPIPRSNSQVLIGMKFGKPVFHPLHHIICIYLLSSPKLMAMTSKVCWTPMGRDLGTR